MTTTLEVDGMTCGGCVQNVTNILKGVQGVQDAQVTLEPARAVVTHEDTVAADTLIGAVEAAGFEARAAGA
ncbi:MAG: heavy-metal-associated domain-containing protein [Leptospirillia bacterium]